MNNTRFNIIYGIDTPPYYMNHVTHNESTYIDGYGGVLFTMGY